MALPIVRYLFNGNIIKFPRFGNLVNKYAPFENLILSDGSLNEFKTKNMALDVNYPVDIKIQESYDGSVNLLLTDDKHKPRLVNSRFSVAEDSRYIIPDHTGNKDTSLYLDDVLEIDVSLLKITTKIVKLDFEGLQNNGMLPCGSYHFYFRLSDNDGNLTDFVSESGVVMVHIGNINDPRTIRMGMANEKTDKSVKFKLYNIDTAYDYVRVYFSRVTSGDDGNDLTTFFDIKEKYSIGANGECSITIYGSEEKESTTFSEINPKYDYIERAKTFEIFLNKLFLGNVDKPTIPYDDLKDFALRIYPEFSFGDSIGLLDSDYIDHDDNKDYGYGYYNAKNVYYRTGYWPGEYYRFGIVFILKDYTLSPVFNIRGVDYVKKSTDNVKHTDDSSYNSIKNDMKHKYEESIKNKNSDYVQEIEDVIRDNYVFPRQFLFNKRVLSDDEGYIINTNRVENKFGISRVPKDGFYNMLGVGGRPICVEFRLTEDAEDTKPFIDGVRSDNDNWYKKIKKHIIGYYFVRQKRTPITLAQGVSIGKTNDGFGNLPVIQNSTNEYISESFLSTETTNDHIDFYRTPNNNNENDDDLWGGGGIVEGTTVDNINPPSIKENSFGATGYREVFQSSLINPSSDNISNRALLIPDANIREPLFNQIFVNNKVGIEKFSSLFEIRNIQGNNNLYAVISSKAPGNVTEIYTKIILVNSGTKLTSTGKEYARFSSLAGTAESILEFSSVLHDWDHEGSDIDNSTPPNTLMKKNSMQFVPLFLKHDLVIRGIFMSYTGIEDSLDGYGHVYNIKDGSFSENNDSYHLLIMLRSNDNSLYYAILDRMDYVNLNRRYKNRCYRGDCYICNYTERVIRNHIDPEVPTNDKITDPTSWSDNFLVMTKFRSNGINSRKFYINLVIPKFKARNYYFLTFDGSKNDWWKILLGKIPVKPIHTLKSLDNMVGMAILMKIIGSLLTITTGFPLMNLGMNFGNEDFSSIYWDLANNDDVFKTGTKLDTLNDLIGILVPSDSGYDKLGDNLAYLGLPNPWSELGTDKIARSDVNSVNLGHWITVRVLSNYNLCMRDIDIYHPQEKALFNAERSFYPLRPVNTKSQFKIQDSHLINGATNVYLSQRPNVLVPDTPYIKQQYDTRVMYSNMDSGKTINSLRIFNLGRYVDYNKELGAIVKLLKFRDSMLAIMEHGIMSIPVDERVLAGNNAGDNVYINSNNPLPQKGLVISNDYGSIWKDSIIATETAVYGVDTIAKVIWKFDGANLHILSDLIMKFLNNNIDFDEWDKYHKAGKIGVKTHFNSYKKDVMFTFYHNDLLWNLCFNEVMDKFQTFYTWMPSHSENINNIWFSFDLDDTRTLLMSSFNNFNTSIDSFCNIDEDSDASSTNNNYFIELKMEKGNYYLEGRENQWKESEKKYINQYGHDVQFSFKTGYGYTVDLDIPETNNNENYDNEFFNICILNNANGSNTIKLSVRDQEILFNGIYGQEDNNKPEELFYILKIEQNDNNTTSYRYYLCKLINGVIILSNLSSLSYYKDITTGKLYYGSDFVLIEDENEITEHESRLNTYNKMICESKKKIFNLYVTSRSNNNDGADILHKFQILNKSINDYHYIWKHGLAGNYEGQEKILPTHWYGKQHPFEFEFIVSETPQLLQLFNSLLFISNNVQPEGFDFEIVGDGYDWFKYKKIIQWANNHSYSQEDLKGYYIYLLTMNLGLLKLLYPDYPKLDGVADTYKIKTIPFIERVRKDRIGKEYLYDNQFEKNSTETLLIEDELLNENRIRVSQLCNDIRKLGRIAGNSEYKEDNWFVEIRHMNYKIAYIDSNNNLKFKKMVFPKIRDKYMRVRVKYSGEDLVLMRGILTMLDHSYA